MIDELITSNLVDIQPTTEEDLVNAVSDKLIEIYE